MKIMRVAALGAMVALNVPADPTVTVCLQGLSAVTGPVLQQAQVIANEMFAPAGVNIDWHRGGLSRSHSQGGRLIVVDLATDTPKQLRPGALAFALPYEGTHITVFYDRVRQTVDSKMVPAVLAHVLVHEITHILEGCDWHTSAGIMKASWTRADYKEITRRPLPFTEEDLQLIRFGLAKAH